MDCTFVIYNEDRKLLLAASDGYKKSLPLATQRQGENPVDCAKRGYKGLFREDIPNHLISLHEQNIVRLEGVILYCIEVREDTASRMPDQWVKMDQALASKNPQSALFDAAVNRGQSIPPLNKEDRTTILPDILAALPYSNSTLSLHKAYTKASLKEAELYFRMYRGYLETIKLILGRNADVRKGDQHIWNEGCFRVIGTETKASIECSLSMNPYLMVEQYEGFLTSLHSEMDALGIAAV